MLRKSGRQAAHARGRLGQARGGADAVITVAIDTHAAMRRMRLLEGLGHAIDRAHRHAQPHQVMADRLARAIAQRVFDGRAQGVAVLQALAVGGEALVFQQRRQPDVVAKFLELAVVHHAQEDVAIAAGKAVVGRDVGMRAAHQPGCALRVHPVGGVRHQQAQRGVEQGHVHALALARAGAVV
ncbi:hypothetical protein D3C72_1184100 [compost metagenome]